MRCSSRKSSIVLRLKDTKLVESIADLAKIPEGKTLINTINAYSYNVAQKDDRFAEALKNGDYLIPDGMPIVKYCRRLHAISQPKERIAGWDLFCFEMKRLETSGRSKVMFVGSSGHVLSLIKKRAEVEYPNLEVITFSPPYKPEFSDADNKDIIQNINATNPDMLWIGMTAPKQEKWTYEHWKELNIHCHVGTIGAVFDFFAGTKERAPEAWQKNGFEWLYRLIKEPKRMWRRYIIGNPEFFFRVISERFK